VLLWFLVLIGLILIHVAIAAAVGPIGDLPANVEAGFYEALKFDKLRSDAAEVRDAARAAVTGCDSGALATGATACSSTSGSSLVFTDTSQQLTSINAAFDSSLEIIDKVVNDIYFGVENFQQTAAFLTEIRAETDQLGQLSQPMSCAVTMGMYCSIYEQAVDLLAQADTVDEQIQTFTNHKFVEEYEDNKDYLQLMHAVPYVLVLSMLFFSCFWYKDASLCGSVLGVGAECCFLLFWIIALVLNSFVVLAGAAVAYYADEITIEDGIRQKATLRELLDHIEAEYPEFHSKVFQPLSDPLQTLLHGVLVFEVFLLLIVLYGCCLCCCRPYRTASTDSDIKAESVVPALD